MTGSFEYFMEVESRLQPLQKKFLEVRKTTERFDVLRKVYSLILPQILQRGCDPYFLEWDFTPIEANAWRCLRPMGMRFYPQFPAGRFFLDFADPILQIGIELDGAAYHEKGRDLFRDEELWGLGWRIFRIPGRNTQPNNSCLTDEMADARYEGASDEDLAAFAMTFGSRWMEGVFWAIKNCYYASNFQPDEWALDVAWRILDRHRLAQFPLDLENSRVAH